MKAQAELEEIVAGEGGRGKKPPVTSPRSEELQGFINRHKDHIVRLEQARRAPSPALFSRAAARLRPPADRP